MSEQLLFINYRRDDEGPAARFVKAELDRYFGQEQTFMDMDNIRIADAWSNTIEANLKKATVLIVIIGKNWLKLHDENFMRRIDNPDDWVRKEIELSLDRGIKIIPLLLGGEMPSKSALPVTIQKITEYQALSITAMHWRHDFSKLIAALKQHGIKSTDFHIPYPIPPEDMLFPLPLTNVQLEKELQKLLGWKKVNYMTREMESKEGTAIEKYFQFKTFKQAIGFMKDTSTHITKIKHHPEWENVFRTLRIRLSTWDIGHKVSNLDIQLARYFENEFSRTTQTVNNI